MDITVRPRPVPLEHKGTPVPRARLEYKVWPDYKG
jgi:hypothetical protein